MASYQTELKKTITKFNHYNLNWVVQNVYKCRNLLHTSIEGPDFQTECSFIFKVKLGQCKHPEERGISLFIMLIDPSKEILANFRVCVRKDAFSNPLLDEMYQFLFSHGDLWESPLLMCNDEFIATSFKEKFNGSWEINIDLMWNDNVTSTRQNTACRGGFLYNLKELGIDLKKFVKNTKLSDVYIQYGDERIPLHKIILEGRCPYFSQMVSSDYDLMWERSKSSLILPKDPNVLNYFLMYLYTGSIETLMENGPLPLGIYQYAKEVKQYDLERLTMPTHISGTTIANYEVFAYDWDLHFTDKKDLQLESWNAKSKYIGNEHIQFQLELRSHFSFVSLYLHLKELKKVYAIYIILDVQIKDGIVCTYRCTEGDMTLMNVERSISIHDVITKPKLLAMPNICFSCRIFSFGSDLTSHTDVVSQDNIISDGFSELLPPSTNYNEMCYGILNLSSDLAQLLITGNQSDCIIIIANIRVPAHRIVLAARSPYFSAVINEKEEERKGSSEGMEIFVEKYMRIDAYIMLIILEEIYTATSKIDKDLVGNIFKFANVFGIKSLIRKCVRILRNVLDSKRSAEEKQIISGTLIGC